MIRKILLLISFLIVSEISASPSIQFQHENKLKKLFHQAINDHAFPGACLVVGDRQHILLMNCYGYFTYDKKKHDTVASEFDLASLTKVVATTPAIMKLYETHQLNLDDRVVKYIPQFQGATAHQTQLKSKITIRDLLTHSSGLPAGTEARTWQGVYQTPVVARRHERTIYSDVNFLLLGKIVEIITHENLDVFTHQAIFKPLGMNHTGFDLKNKNNIIPTEYSVKKQRYFRGIPNDPISRNFGGIAGNAGLFSTAEDLSRFAQMMLNNGNSPNGRIFKSSTVQLFTQRANLVKNSTRTLGWDTAYLNGQPGRPKNTQHQFTAGLYIDSRAYGHTGYTGTSLWISPRYGVFVLLLTNRVYPNIEKANYRAQRYWRQELDSQAWKDMGFKKKNPLYKEKLRSSR